MADIWRPGHRGGDELATMVTVGAIPQAVDVVEKCDLRQRGRRIAKVGGKRATGGEQGGLENRQASG